VSQIDILEAFAESDSAMSAADVIAKTALPRSTVFRALRVLVGNGFLNQEPNTRKYTLGPRILQLGMAAQRQMSADDLVAAPLLELLQESEETVTFSILDLPWRICTYVLEAPSDIRQVAQVGARYPLHLGSAGKVILAYLPEEVARSVISGEGLEEEQARDMLKQLEEIRLKGYSTTVGERVSGAAAISAPVFVQQQIFGSVAMTGPTERVIGKLDQYRPTVLEAAKTITDRLSARVAPHPSRDRRRTPATSAVKSQ